MHIKIGFDIELAITSPMAILYLLHVHPSRRADLVQPDIVTIDPIFMADEYIDVFGNQCGRVNAFAGMNQVRFHSEAVIRDSGLPDEVHWSACSRTRPICPWKHCNICCPAAIAKWTVNCCSLPGTSLATPSRDGPGCRRFATLCMATCVLITARPAQRARPWRAGVSEPVCAGISPTWRSHCAVA